MLKADFRLFIHVRIASKISIYNFIYMYFDMHVYLIIICTCIYSDFLNIFLYFNAHKIIDRILNLSKIKNSFVLR